jgi:hypothetical protein
LTESATEIETATEIEIETATGIGLMVDQEVSEVRAAPAVPEARAGVQAVVRV